MSDDPYAQPDWDAIAAEVGLPADWREQGYDTAETMETHYRQDNGVLLCPWPECNHRTRGVEAMFRHAHGGHR